MTYATDVESITREVPPQERQTRRDRAACFPSDKH